MDQIKRNARQMALGIAIAFFFLTFCIYLFNKKISEELKESYKVHLSGEEILRIAASHSNALVFEYHIRGQLLIRKTEEENLLFSEEIIHNVPDSILQKGILDKESEALFIDAFTKIREEEKVSVTVKVVSEQQHFWYQILMNNIYDESHQIINTVGAVSDITELKPKEEMVQEEKRRKEEFQEKAERDGLTGLYNGSTANEKINHSSFTLPRQPRESISWSLWIWIISKKSMTPLAISSVTRFSLTSHRFLLINSAITILLSGLAEMNLPFF